MHTCVLFAMPVAGRRTTQAVITTVTDSVVSFLRDDRGLGPSTAPRQGAVVTPTCDQPVNLGRSCASMQKSSAKSESAEGLTPSVNYKYFLKFWGTFWGSSRQTLCVPFCGLSSL